MKNNKRTDKESIIICTIILLMIIFLCIFTESRYFMAKLVLIYAWTGLVRVMHSDLKEE